MSKQWRVLAGLAVLAAVAGAWQFPGAAARDGEPAKAKAADRPADRAALAEALGGLARALRGTDGSAVAAFWTTEGEYQGPEGAPLRGREAIGKAYTAVLAKSKGLEIESKVETLRFLGADLALVEGQATRAGEKDGPSLVSRFSALVTREKGRWLLASLREWPETPEVALTDLAWLVGDWTTGTKDRVVTAKYEWMNGKSFLRGTFTITEKGKAKAKEPATGLQIIARDAADGVLRAWVFEAGGGFSEGTWSREGKRWLLESTGTGTDGSRTAATTILIPLDADSFTWQAVERSSGGEPRPDAAPVKVTRVKTDS